MNLSYHNNVDTSLFTNSEATITSFDVLSQILPPISTRFANKLYDSDENKKTSNNIIEIVNGQYKRGSIDKSVLGAGSKGLIQTIFNDFNYNESADFIDNLQAIVTEYMKLSAYSVGISDLIADDKTNQRIIAAVNEKKKEVNDLINQFI